MSVKVRDAVAGDARRFEEIRVEGWRAAYGGLIDADFLASYDVDEARVLRREQWLDAMGPHEVMLVAELGGEVVGGAIAGACRDDDLIDAAELWALYVDPARHRNGIGSSLLEPTLARLPHDVQVLWVLEGNTSARRFYEVHGFGLDGARKQLEVPGRPVEVRYRRRRLR